MTLDDIYMTLATIRETRTRRDKSPYWVQIFDFFLDEATPDERRILIDIVSRDKQLYGTYASRLPHGNYQDNVMQYLRRALASMLLNNGGTDPCALPRYLYQVTNWLSKFVEDATVFDATIAEVAQMGSPRMRTVLLERRVDEKQFSDYGDLNCNGISDEFLGSIEDSQVRQLFEQLTLESGYYLGWEDMTDFYRYRATETQRKQIHRGISQTQFHHAIKFRPYAQAEGARRYIEASLIITMIRSSSDWEMNMYVLGNLQNVAREYDLDFSEIARPIYDMSPEIFQKQLKNRIKGVE